MVQRFFCFSLIFCNSQWPFRHHAAATTVYLKTSVTVPVPFSHFFKLSLKEQSSTRLHTDSIVYSYKLLLMIRLLFRQKNDTGRHAYHTNFPFCPSWKTAKQKFNIFEPVTYFCHNCSDANWPRIDCAESITSSQGSYTDAVVYRVLTVCDCNI